MTFGKNLAALWLIVAVRSPELIAFVQKLAVFVQTVAFAAIALAQVVYIAAYNLLMARQFVAEFE